MIVGLRIYWLADLRGGKHIPFMSHRKRSTPAAHDLRNQPAYTVVEAARYLKLPPATLRTWVAGRDYPSTDGRRHFEPLIIPASESPPILSFWNLIEGHVLSALRRVHGVSVRKVREALDVAEKEHGVSRLLLSRELRTAAGSLFLERYGELIELSSSGQLALRKIFEAYLERIDWDEREFPVRLFPFLPSDGVDASRPIAIDPGIAFGRPILKASGIAAEVIADRVDVGESPEEIAADYGIPIAEVQQAILYVRAA